MKICQIVVAYPALLKLTKKIEDDYDVTYKLYRLKLAMKNDVDYFAENQLEILRKYGKERETEPGVYDIISVLDRLKANDELKALNATESSTIFEKTKISNKNLKITADDIEVLEPFIDFIFEDKENKLC